jgi:hypothetical protein
VLRFDRFHPPLMHMLDFASLRTAIILLDRPVVGVDGHRAHDRLPPTLRVRATVVGQGPVACTIAADAVRALAGSERPTFADLEAVWQSLATSIDEKIRAGGLSARDQPHGWAGVDITPEDVTVGRNRPRREA